MNCFLPHTYIVFLCDVSLASNVYCFNTHVCLFLYTCSNGVYTDSNILSVHFIFSDGSYQLKVNKLFSYEPGNIREDAKCVYIL